MGLYVRTSLSRTFLHDGPLRLSRSARSTCPRIKFSACCHAERRMNFAKRSSFVVEASLLAAHCHHHGFFASLGMTNEEERFSAPVLLVYPENNRACSSGG